MCYHLWLLLKGLQRDGQNQKAELLQGATGVVEINEVMLLDREIAVEGYDGKDFASFARLAR